ncbi:hypothetical protein [Psychromonas sp. Urea-02u-13]|uniref:hypothetical protein n=1 Tax=Psychromonas sp. Urea-02u-13 TaxID=2058326 RepID=UPI000C322A41|nr:hypothetical protein [Psychromonas sp. Urea-02u-13]PKG39284.1 hypothetical protein CXF74_08975 [Psychromonas sp. Urea-02u-13]
MKEFNIPEKLTSLRQLHLRSSAKIWSESESIEQFLVTCNSEELDFRFQDPSDYSEFKDKYWVTFMKELGPKNPLKVACKDNPYLFWYEGVVPFFNTTNGEYLVQPYINNSIVLKLPKAPEVGGYELANALSSYSAISSWLFTDEDPQKQKEFEYKNSGANTLGDLHFTEELFNTDPELFIKNVGRYSVYFSPAYAIFYEKEYGKPLLYDNPTELIANSLAPIQPKPSYDLNNDTGTYLSFGAAMQKLVALMWTDNDVWKLIITKDKDAHKPGQTIKLIEQLLGYNYPFYLDLVLEEDENIVYDQAQDKWVWLYDEETCNSLVHKQGERGLKAGKKYNNPQLPLQELILAIPAPPKQASLSPVALMSYNTDNSGYPFSC